jgi:dihydrolipoamide dehydrogenase
MGQETLRTELAVIGGGPGGYAAAFRAADLGMEVVLINQEERLGGVCLRRGCIPSKALLQLSKTIHDTWMMRDWGVEFGKPEIDVASVQEWKNKIVDRLVGGLEGLCEKRDIKIIQGRAEFDSAESVRLHGPDIANVEFEHAILATGGTPVPLPDVEFTGRIMDSKAALEFQDIPDSLLVVGGGYIGLELGSVYASLGSSVTVAEMTGSLLPGTDPDLVRVLSGTVSKRFENVHLNTKVTNVEQSDNDVSITFEGEEQWESSFDRVLVAIGRSPASRGFGLEEIGVELDDDGYVSVDEQRRTSKERIYAVGDVVGGPLLAHKAMHEGKIAAEAIAGKPAEYDVRCVPAVVYTDPELAWCGLTEEEGKNRDRPVKASTFPWAASGRALTMGEPDGLTKMTFDEKTERILGIGIVGRGAEDMIAEGALAIEMGAVARDVALTIHPHPTLSETISEGGEAFLGIATHILGK